MSNRAFLCLQRQGVQQFRIREKEGEKTACYQVVNKLLTKSQRYTSQVLKTHEVSHMGWFIADLFAHQVKPKILNQKGI